MSCYSVAFIIEGLFKIDFKEASLKVIKFKGRFCHKIFKFFYLIFKPPLL